MNELEANVKTLIIDRYGSMKKFSEKIEMSWTASLSMTDHLEDPVKQGFRNIVRYRNG